MESLLCKKLNADIIEDSIMAATNARSLDWLKRGNWRLEFKEFSSAIEISKKECEYLPKVHEFFFMFVCAYTSFLKVRNFFVTTEDNNRFIADKYKYSLFFNAFLEFFRVSSQNAYLCASGLYRNVYFNLRFALESMVQTLYIDNKYPNGDLVGKMMVMQEIESLDKCRGVQLIKKIQLPNQDQIVRENDKIHKRYDYLSNKIHFNNKQLYETIMDFNQGKLKSTKVDCNEVKQIYESMQVVYDFFFLLFLSYFPETKEPLLENKEFIDAIKDHDLVLTCRILGVKIAH